MISEVYEAFREAGVSEEKSRRAAEAMSAESIATKGDIRAIERRFDWVDGKLKRVKWMLALIITVEALPFVKALFAH